MYSVIILTRDEAINIADCIASQRSDDIIVLDSFSDDRTCAIAQEAGARVHQRRFDHYAGQRNAALALPDMRYRWALMVDADERMTNALHAEIMTVLRDVPQDVDLFRMRRKDMFLGRWIRRSSGYPTWFGRLVRLGSVRVEREINEEFHCEGIQRELREHLIHLPFNKGVDYWFERHNRYSSMEAVTLQGEAARPLAWRALMSRDPVRRRQAAKQLAYRMPCRPILVFLYLYVVRGGFRDGIAGYLFCRMRSLYEAMIDVKVSVGRHSN